MRGFAYLLIAVWWLTPAGSVFAEQVNGTLREIPPRASHHAPNKGPASAKSGNASTGWTTVAGALAVVVVLILAVARVFQQRGVSGPGGLPREAVHVLGRKLIDYRHTIHLVRCGSRLLVLGSSQTGLTTLAEITDPSEVEELEHLCTASEPVALTDSFGELIRRLRTEPADSNSVDREVNPTVLRLRERLASAQRVNDESADPSSIREGTG